MDADGIDRVWIEAAQHLAGVRCLRSTSPPRPTIARIRRGPNRCDCPPSARSARCSCGGWRHWAGAGSDATIIISLTALSEPALPVCADASIFQHGNSTSTSKGVRASSGMPPTPHESLTSASFRKHTPGTFCHDHETGSGKSEPCRLIVQPNGSLLTRGRHHPKSRRNPRRAVRLSRPLISQASDDGKAPGK